MKLGLHLKLDVALVMNSQLFDPEALMFQEQELIHQGRFHSWIYMTRCVSQYLQLEVVVAHKWLPLMWGTQTQKILFVQNVKMDVLDNLIFRCSLPKNLWKRLGKTRIGNLHFQLLKKRSMMRH